MAQLRSLQHNANYVIYIVGVFSIGFFIAALCRRLNYQLHIFHLTLMLLARCDNIYPRRVYIAVT